MIVEKSNTTGEGQGEGVFPSSPGAELWHDDLSWKPLCGLLDQAPTKDLFYRRGANLLRPILLTQFNDTPWCVELWVSKFKWSSHQHRVFLIINVNIFQYDENFRDYQPDT